MGAVAFHVPVAEDELVEVFEALVIPGVGDDAPILSHDHVRALMLEAAERGVLLRGGIGSHGSTSTT